MKNDPMGFYSRYNIFLLPILLLILTSACGRVQDAGSIDLDAWKNDRMGCKGLRLQHVDELREIKNTFLAATNQELLKTFGRPDRVELADRSQSFFIYFLEPAEECGEGTKKEPLKVLFRMNAINKVSEVTVTTLNP
ncbi:hypothetical protein [Lunatimonas salinarum]|uniref:hypothetical protein n=1 Tax=Lunatimonas salinarum TaxID=1774590 RepID=UPI001FD81361|nr:hypothetical protein [Lunatimonas salinarum]